ncbi:MAG: UDP-3-O-(3-hydroxymyristoyl)glucosamine N-acyltransferase, partial [Planctomycetes bacterium]|nr:UDP-3-O-(3-hydroxymyristoyl)glucosamine N-acyltransferase [Planctomycetota bacterium]
MENGSKNKTLSRIAELIGAELVGDGSIQINGINGLAAAGADEITFVSDEKYFGKIKESSAAAIITDKKPEGITTPLLLVKSVDMAVIEVLKIFAKGPPPPQPGIHPGAVVEAGVEIGEGTYIGPGCYVGANSRIGSNSRLDANVVIYHNCRIGNNCVIQSNTTIGAIGFGYSFIDGQHRLIPHIGGVIIEDFVEIGAN